MRYHWKHSAVLGVPLVRLIDSGGPHTLEAVIAPTLGGNIVSLIFDGVELLHRGGNMAPEPRGGWDGKAPLLWPAVGRQRYGAYSWPPAGSESSRHAMPLHGFAKDAAFEIISTHATDFGGVKLCLRLHWRDIVAFATAFPFQYRLELEFTVYQNVLSVTHTVENLASSGNMPFAVGNHLSLRFPFRGPAESGWRAGSITSSATEQHLLDAGSLLSGSTVDRARELSPGGGIARSRSAPALDVPIGMRLDAPGATDGVFGLPAVTGGGGTPPSRPCWMTLSQPGVLSVRVSQELCKPTRRPGSEGASSPGTWNEAAWGAAQDHRHFVLWGEPPPAAPPGGLAPLEDSEPGFLCVEPWQSGPDSLNTGLGVVVLAPSQRAGWVFRVEATELCLGGTA
jgi:galactose mutarotase-like enzyme